ncbi:hypothetical protein B0H10DRAFT_2095254 [Mycena sp. CBHHK59/15]|nr:hypothetical protein B0H10DRAFT_2095254 [Mycena sp. CBHHK59/15]
MQWRGRWWGCSVRTPRVDAHESVEAARDGGRRRWSRRGGGGGPVGRRGGRGVGFDKLDRGWLGREGGRGRRRGEGGLRHGRGRGNIEREGRQVDVRRGRRVGVDKLDRGRGRCGGGGGKIEREGLDEGDAGCGCRADVHGGVIGRWAGGRWVRKHPAPPRGSRHSEGGRRWNRVGSGALTLCLRLRLRLLLLLRLPLLYLDHLPLLPRQAVPARQAPLPVALERHQRVLRNKVLQHEPLRELLDLLARDRLVRRALLPLLALHAHERLDGARDRVSLLVDARILGQLPLALGVHAVGFFLFLFACHWIERGMWRGASRGMGIAHAFV